MYSKNNNEPLYNEGNEAYQSLYEVQQLDSSIDEVIDALNKVEINTFVSTPEHLEEILEKGNFLGNLPYSVFIEGQKSYSYEYEDKSHLLLGNKTRVYFSGMSIYVGNQEYKISSEIHPLLHKHLLMVNNKLEITG